MFARRMLRALFVTSLLFVGVAADVSEANEAATATTGNSMPSARRHHRARRAHRPPRVSSGTRWAAVAVSLQNGGVSTGNAWGYNSPSEATSRALARCRETGRPGCYIAVGPVTGCLYVSISYGGQSRSAWGTSGNAAKARANCESRGLNCKPAQGGC